VKDKINPGKESFEMLTRTPIKKKLDSEMKNS
jgi:hypothetical protein